MRASGVLMHLSSLPSPYGIGTMGQAAREFIDFLKKAGQKYWQMLPVCPTSYGDSPYQSFSTFAGNPYFIDLDELEKEGLLEKSDYADIDWESSADRVNYGALYEKRYPLLKKACECFLQGETKEYEAFCKEQESWLEDYALFMTLKDLNNGVSWQEWDERVKRREENVLCELRSKHTADITFWKVTQFFSSVNGKHYIHMRQNMVFLLLAIYQFM